MLQRAKPRPRPDRVARTHSFGSAAPWVFGFALTGLVSAAGPSLPEPAINETPIDFSIPAQPLAAALGRYGDATGREALYDASLAIGRVSGDVRGILTPTDALERLLAGTGLSARFVADGTFVLLLRPPANSAATTQTQSSTHRRYYALIQTSLLDALCRDGSARPGHYRMIFVFRIGPNAAVYDARRIGTAGDAELDQQIDAAVRGVRFKEPPPAGFAQPVRILIVPQALGVNPGCTSADAPLQASEGER